MLTVRTRASDETTLVLMHVLSPCEAPTAVALQLTSHGLVGLSGGLGWRLGTFDEEGRRMSAITDETSPGFSACKPNGMISCRPIHIERRWNRWT
jgi:hypothetical protein